MRKVMSVAAVAAILAWVVAAPPAHAQGNSCQSIRLLLQANLDFTRPFPGTGWSGIVRGFLNDTEPLNGTLYYLPPTQQTKGTGQSAHEYANRAVFDFGAKGKFVTAAGDAVFQLMPGVSPHMTYPPDLAFGHYAATVQVAPDADPQLTSGRFLLASGNLSISGLFLVNVPPPAVADIGIWNAEINGKLCGVLP